MCAKPYRLGAQGHCEECLSDHFRPCGICREWVRSGAGEHCRHVFWVNDPGAWSGSGEDSGDWNWAIRDSFLKLLDKIPSMAFDLLVALRTDGIAMSILAATGGLGPTLVRFEAGGRSYGQEMETLEDDPDVEDVSNAAMWLLSLYKQETKEANERTVLWIREWIKNGWKSNGLVKEAVAT